MDVGNRRSRFYNRVILCTMAESTCPYNKLHTWSFLIIDDSAFSHLLQKQGLSKNHGIPHTSHQNKWLITNTINDTTIITNPAIKPLL